MTPKPEDRCGLFEAVLFLSGAVLFVTGVVIAVLSVQPWKWGNQ